MTASVCIFCGSMKVGAWTPCDSCGQVPRTESEFVAALVATDRYHDADALEELSAHVRRGGTIDVNPSTRRDLVALLRATKVHELAAAMGVESMEEAADGGSHVASGRPAKRWEFWKSRPAPQSDTSRSRALESEAFEAANRGDWSTTLRLLTEALQSPSAPWTVWANRGKAFLNLGRHQEAIADLSKALRASPEGARAAILNDRGVARSKAGDPDGAIADYSAALERDPEFHPAILNRGAALFDLEDDEGALEDAEAALRLGVPGAADLFDAIKQSLATRRSVANPAHVVAGADMVDVQWRFEEGSLCEQVSQESGEDVTIRADRALGILHALAHIWLRSLHVRAKGRAQAHDPLIRLEGWAGVEDGDWTAEQEERAAVEIEAYLLTRPEASSLRPKDARPPAREIVPVLDDLMRLLGKPSKTP